MVCGAGVCEACREDEVLEISFAYTWENSCGIVKSTNRMPVKDCKKCLLNVISKIVIINIAQNIFLYFDDHEM